jgi:hypothetical protein
MRYRSFVWVELYCLVSLRKFLCFSINYKVLVAKKTEWLLASAKAVELNRLHDVHFLFKTEIVSTRTMHDRYRF